MRNFPVQMILEKRKSKTYRKEDPLTNLWEKIRRGVLLVNYVEKSKSSKIKSESRRLFFSNLITAFEVYMGDLTLEFIDAGVIDLKKIPDSITKNKTFSIFEVEEIINNNLTTAELICHMINFQNIDQVEELLSCIFGVKFWDYIRGYKFIYRTIENKEECIEWEGDYYNKLKKILESRHNHIHDITFRNTPRYSNLYESRQTIIDLAFTIEVLANQFRDNRECRIEKK